jgi:hypothetical protein
MRLSRLVGIGIIATCCGIMDSQTALASPIHPARHRDDALVAKQEAARSWSTYLLAGPSEWSAFVHPRVTPEVHAVVWKALRSDSPESSAWVEFLLWKQSLDPERFARFHPRVSPMLDKISSANLTPQVIPVPTPTGPTDTTTPVTQAQSLTAPVPEPGPLLLALGMTGWGLWWRRRSR